MDMETLSIFTQLLKKTKMLEVSIKNKDIKLDQFKDEMFSEWDKDINKSKLVKKVCIILNGINKQISDNIKDAIRGNAKLKAFGRFEFQGSISFNINDFYITLHNVDISGFVWDSSHNRLQINFKELPGFGYLSGMGTNVLRDQKLKDLGI